MAKRLKGKKKTEAEMAEIERDRLAAHGVSDEQVANIQEHQVPAPDAVVGANVTVGEFDDKVATESPPTDPAQGGANEPFPQGEPELNGRDGGEGEHPQDDGEGEPTEEKPVTSVVADKYKTKYIENAKVLGIGGKAVKRSNWDWLAETLAKHCLGEKEKISIEKFTEVLDLNGVDHSKWTNRNRGWEGRFRMTGRVVLQKKVADANLLRLPGADDVVPPAAFVERFKTKA